MQFQCHLIFLLGLEGTEGELNCLAEEFFCFFFFFMFSIYLILILKRKIGGECFHNADFLSKKRHMNSRAFESVCEENWDS